MQRSLTLDRDFHSFLLNIQCKEGIQGQRSYFEERVSVWGIGLVCVCVCVREYKYIHIYFIYTYDLCIQCIYIYVHMSVYMYIYKYIYVCIKPCIYVPNYPPSPL